MEIQHFAHRHPLSLIDDGNKNIRCDICWRRLSGPTYLCRKCRIFFHKYCIDKLKQEVQCFFHPCPLLLFTSGSIPCHVCNIYFLGFGYGCKSCDIFVQVECALKAMPEYSDKENNILHFTHHHPLKPVTFNQEKDVSSIYNRGDIECAICSKDVCSSSPTYGCTECKFFLHKSFMTTIPGAGRLTNHLIHPCTLVINYFKYYTYYKCDKCGEAKRRILVFSCWACGFYLHVECALLSNTDSEEAKEIQHLSHPHRLELIQNHQEYGNQPRCAACGQTCLPPTPTFRCSKSSCANFFLHRSCAVNFPHQPLLLHHHPCHPNHKLAITTLPYNDRVPNPTCGACCRSIGIDSSLLAYRCSTDGCYFTLHLDCGKLSASFVCDGHPHRLVLIEKTGGFPCHACGVNCSTFVLRCAPCNFNIHLQCLPSAPTTITHKSHLHSLVLTTKSPLQHELNSEEDDYNSDDEFYCDVCEQKRYKREPVYYCAECKFIAELKCVISEVLSLIPKRDTTQQGGLYTFDEEKEEEEEEEKDPGWEISKIIYKLEELKQKKNELVKSLESVMRDIEQTQNSFDRFVKHAHK